MATDSASAEAGSTMLSIEKSEFERLQVRGFSIAHGWLLWHGLQACEDPLHSSDT